MFFNIKHIAKIKRLLNMVYFQNLILFSPFVKIKSRMNKIKSIVIKGKFFAIFFHNECQRSRAKSSLGLN
jgi:hypothetical protein